MLFHTQTPMVLFLKTATASSVCFKALKLTIITDPRPRLTPGRPWSPCGCWSPAALWCWPPPCTLCMTCSAKMRRPSIKVSWQYSTALCDLMLWCQGCGQCAGPWWSSTCWRGSPGLSWASTGSSARGSSPASSAAMTASLIGSVSQYEENDHKLCQ